MRKIYWVILFILFVIGSTVAIYFVFLRGPIATGPNSNTLNVNGGTLPSTNIDANRVIQNSNTSIPAVNGGVTNTSPANVNASPVANGGVTQVQTITSATGTITDAHVNSATGKAVYYSESDGKFYEVNADGQAKRELTSQEFADVEHITWSSSGGKAVIEFPDDAKIVYDFDSQKQYTLPKESEGFSFSPDGNSLAYKYLPSDVEDRYLVTTNIDGTNLKFIEPIGDEANNVQVNWSPKGDIVATFRESIDSTRQEVFFIGQNKENFKSAIVEGRGFEGSWSTTGNQLVYSVYSAESNYNPELYIVNASGNDIGSGRTDLGLQTWSNKCAFSQSGTELYCAEPSFLSPGTGLYPDQATANDKFYTVNLLTGDTQLLADPNIAVNATDLSLSADGKILYFMNSATGRLESIRLP